MLLGLFFAGNDFGKGLSNEMIFDLGIDLAFLNFGLNNLGFDNPR